MSTYLSFEGACPYFLAVCVVACEAHYAQVCARLESGHVDLTSQSLSLTDLSHRCVAVTRGGAKSNI